MLYLTMEHHCNLQLLIDKIGNYLILFRSAIHLMKKGADLNITSGQMPSFLHLLIDQDNNEVFEVAFQEHHNAIDVNVKDSTGCSAL